MYFKIDESIKAFLATKTYAVMPIECLDCLNTKEGVCRLHRRPEPTLEEKIAINCQRLVDIGVASRVSDTMIQIF